METLLNQIIAALLVITNISSLAYFIFIKKEIPSFKVVLTVISVTLLISIAIICISIPFYPVVIDWIKQAYIPMTIVGLLVLTLVTQIIWKEIKSIDITT